jgi:hypothetical protein
VIYLRAYYRGINFNPTFLFYHSTARIGSVVEFLSPSQEVMYSNPYDVETGSDCFHCKTFGMQIRESHSGFSKFLFVKENSMLTTNGMKTNPECIIITFMEASF